MALSKGQLDIIRQSLGLGSEVPDKDIRELAGTKAGMAILKKAQGQGQEGFLQQAEGFVKGGVQGLEQAKGTKNIEKLFAGVQGAKPAAPAKKKASTTGGSSSEQDALQKLAQWLTSNYQEQGSLAMAQQGQEMAQQNKGITNIVDQGLAQAGAASGSPAVAAAMNAYANAFSAGEGIQAASYANAGAANAQYLAESPLYPVANLLTQGFGSTQYKQIPANIVAGLPPEILQALSQAGVTQSSPSGGSGGTPIGVPKGTSTTGGANLAQILGLAGQTGPGNPNSAVGQTLTPGKPSNPTS
jgi:hypothetical protein